VTTYPVRPDAEISEALTTVIKHAVPDPATTAAFCELRSAFEPNNGFHVPHVPYGIREAMAGQIRSAIPAASKMEQLAAGLEASER
jgi:hypothetical protein